MRLLRVVSGLAVAATAVVAFAQAHPGEVEPPSLEQLRSGVGRVEILNCDGTPFRGTGPGWSRAVSGSGFLVGSRVVVSAEHGLWVGQRPNQPACKLRVRFGAKTYAVTRVHVWSERGERDRLRRRKIDLMTLALAQPVDGHLFGFARAAARAGTPVATLGYPGGGRLTLARGVVTGNVVDGVVPSTAVKMKIVGGNSGGPIFNARGEVLSFVSRLVIAGNVTADQSERCRRYGVCSNWGGVGFPRWWPDAAADLCTTYPDGGIPGCGDVGGIALTKVPIEIRRK